jgi:hypothetical protein
MAIGDENQMIDQIDTRNPQELRRVARGSDIGVTWPGNARRVIVRHHNAGSAAGEQRAPASRRDNATSRRSAIDAIETDKPLIRIEGRKDQAFTVAVELRAQQMGYNRIFGIARHEAATPGIGPGCACRFKDRHCRRMAQARGQPNRRLPRIGWIGGQHGVTLLSSRGAGPSNGGKGKGSAPWLIPSIMNCNIST